MSEPTYPFSGANFKAHTVATHALIALVIIIAFAVAYVLVRTTSPIPEHLPMVLGFSAVGFIVVWIVLLTTFDAKNTAQYINERERMEKVLLDLVELIDSTKSIDLGQKRVLLEWYVKEMGYLNWPLAAEHLKHVDFKAGGSMHQILDVLNRETAAEVIKKIGDNGGTLPHQQVDVLNGNSMLFSKIKVVILP